MLFHAQTVLLLQKREPLCCKKHIGKFNCPVGHCNYLSHECDCQRTKKCLWGLSLVVVGRRWRPTIAYLQWSKCTPVCTTPVETYSFSLQHAVCWSFAWAPPHLQEWNLQERGEIFCSILSHLVLAGQWTEKKSTSIFLPLRLEAVFAFSLVAAFTLTCNFCS